MVWRRYPFEPMWREMEEMRAELDNLFRQVSAQDRFLLPGGINDRVLPTIRGEFRVDVRDHDDEVIVVADLPGVEKEAVSLNLVNPRALEISCEKNKETEDKAEGYYVRERVYGTMRRIVALPSDVTDSNAKASFKNGVLEVTLKKTRGTARTTIEIE
ncbi:MAG: Hsp20/alpha crystallin family protein [Methanomicrobiales archaeon]|nr:Hsp20/alpha crystallin family protein [Methanomicrobiales archaeon]